MLIISIIRQTLTTMALLFPRRTLITLIVHVMSGIVRSSPWSHPPLTALHNCDTKRVESIFRSWVVLFLPFSFVRHLFRSIKAAHTSHIRRNMSDFMGVSAVQCGYSCSNYIFNAYHSSSKSGCHPIRTQLFRLPYNESPPFPLPLCWECLCYT